MEIKRDLYLSKLIRHKHNGMIKVITGIRRCGKSYLLFELFYRHLLECGVDDRNILKIALDDRVNKAFRNPDYLCEYVHNFVQDKEMHYILLDEVQMVEEFEDVLNSFLHIKNADVYVTGSNAKFLSKDIITEFRGRGDQIQIAPLSFSEFMSAYGGSKEDGWRQYINFGGLPKLFEFSSDEDKSNYLKSIFTETYIKDIKDRNSIRNDAEIEELLDILASAIGSFTNPKKLANTFKTVKQTAISPETIKAYLDYFINSFLVEQAKRYDIKGRKYIGTPCKYYFTDVGLRNARLNFRQVEETHAMENVVYNELKVRGFNVDVGVVEYYAKNAENKSVLNNAEVDFVCNLADKRIYIQVAYALPTLEKIEQEQNSLVRIDDSFKKVIIVKDISRSHYMENGIYLLSLFDFLLNPNSLNF